VKNSRLKPTLTISKEIHFLVGVLTEEFRTYAKERKNKVFGE
jgi:hypothetical protein